MQFTSSVRVATSLRSCAHSFSYVVRVVVRYCRYQCLYSYHEVGGDLLEWTGTTTQNVITSFRFLIAAVPGTSESNVQHYQHRTNPFHSYNLGRSRPSAACRFPIFALE